MCREKQIPVTTSAVLCFAPFQTDCKMQVAATWTTKHPPKVTVAELEHSRGCVMEQIAAALVDQNPDREMQYVAKAYPKSGSCRRLPAKRKMRCQVPSPILCHESETESCSRSRPLPVKGKMGCQVASLIPCHESETESEKTAGPEQVAVEVEALVGLEAPSGVREEGVEAYAGTSDEAGVDLSGGVQEWGGVEACAGTSDDAGMDHDEHVSLQVHAFRESHKCSSFCRAQPKQFRLHTPAC